MLSVWPPGYPQHKMLTANQKRAKRSLQQMCPRRNIKISSCPFFLQFRSCGVKLQVQLGSLHCSRRGTRSIYIQQSLLAVLTEGRRLQLPLLSTEILLGRLLNPSYMLSVWPPGYPQHKVLTANQKRAKRSLQQMCPRRNIKISSCPFFLQFRSCGVKLQVQLGSLHCSRRGTRSIYIQQSLLAVLTEGRRLQLPLLSTEILLGRLLNPSYMLSVWPPGYPQHKVLTANQKRAKRSLQQMCPRRNIKISSCPFFLQFRSCGVKLQVQLGSLHCSRRGTKSIYIQQSLLAVLTEGRRLQLPLLSTEILLGRLLNPSYMLSVWPPGYPQHKMLTANQKRAKRSLQQMCPRRNIKISSCPFFLQFRSCGVKLQVQLGSLHCSRRGTRSIYIQQSLLAVLTEGRRLQLPLLSTEILLGRLLNPSYMLSVWPPGYPQHKMLTANQKRAKRSLQQMCPRRNIKISSCPFFLQFRSCGVKLQVQLGSLHCSRRGTRSIYIQQSLLAVLTEGRRLQLPLLSTEILLGRLLNPSYMLSVWPPGYPPAQNANSKPEESQAFAAANVSTAKHQNLLLSTPRGAA